MIGLDKMFRSMGTLWRLCKVVQARLNSHRRHSEGHILEQSVTRPWQFRGIPKRHDTTGVGAPLSGVVMQRETLHQLAGF